VISDRLVTPSVKIVSESTNVMIGNISVFRFLLITILLSVKLVKIGRIKVIGD